MLWAIAEFLGNNRCRLVEDGTEFQMDADDTYNLEPGDRISVVYHPQDQFVQRLFVPMAKVEG
jgi:hypothetical protein